MQEICFYQLTQKQTSSIFLSVIVNFIDMADYTWILWDAE